MKFHLTHGSAVALSRDRTIATRDDSSFCNGIVFGEQALTFGQKICLQLECIASWSGALRLGVTSINPSTLTQQDLPKYAYPNLTAKEGYWARAIPERLVYSGCRVMVYVTPSGQLQVFIDGQHKGVLLAGLPVSSVLWLLADIYGNTFRITFVKPDGAPREILARGLEAVQAYDQSCTQGTQPVFRTRLMLVGKDRVGKTSLKRALTGQQHNAAEESTDGIDLSASCSFNLSNRSSWKLAVKGDIIDQGEKKQDDFDFGGLGNVKDLEEEYNWAVATNIVQELLSQQLNHNKSSGIVSPPLSASCTPATSSANNSNSNSCRLSRSTSIPGNASVYMAKAGKQNVQDSWKSAAAPPRHQSASSSTSHTSFQGIVPEISPGVPERVAVLVQEMLESMQQKGSAVSLPVNPVSGMPRKNQSVVLNIWDFAGQAVYYTTHQVFLTSRAVYVIVFNLCHHLNLLSSTNSEAKEEEELSTSEYMDFWMRSIHSHAAENTRENVDSNTLSPPIFVVGTHRNSLHSDPNIRAEMVAEKFNELRDFLMGKPYTHHLVTPFFAVENSLDGDEEVGKLKAEIERVAGEQPYMGEQMPVRWLHFEQQLTQQADNGIHCATLSQVSEIARNYGVESQKELHTLLTFYHDLGLLIYYGGRQDSVASPDTVLTNTVVLSPQWLAHNFHKIVTGSRPQDQWELHIDKWEQLEKLGVLDVALLGHLWPRSLPHKPVLLGLMEKLDLLCPLPSASQPQSCLKMAAIQTDSRREAIIGLKNTQRSMSPNKHQDGHETSQKCIVPMRLPFCHDVDTVFIRTADDVVFYLDFCGFLPDGLFFRILNRALRWSQERGGRDQCLRRQVARFYLDPDHDFVLHMFSRLHRVRVVIMNVGQQEATSSKRRGKPSPSSCALVRNFLESTLADLRHHWMKRISCQLCVVCPCERVCEKHKFEACSAETCLHFLHLDECLANKVVCCDHRRIKTDQFQDWFPKPPVSGFQSPVVANIKLSESHGNIEKRMEKLPSWMKEAAKLLNSGEINQDWAALAHLLGYNSVRMERLMEDINPPLALLTDWIVSNGNTAMAVDLLTSYLQQLGRSDIVQIIHRAKESDGPVPQVFLSYQWEAQDQVKALRDQLERFGYICWMDVGQMGGGDHLNAKIEEGLRNCKVVVACLTPRYLASQLCTRELCLADLMQRPIVPVMLHPVPWPPPGPLALILSQLVCINMKGVGGHGGMGIHADMQDKHKEILQRVAIHASPTRIPCISFCSSRSPAQQPLKDWSDVSRQDTSNSSTSHPVSIDTVSDRSAHGFQDGNESSGDVLLSHVRVPGSRPVPMAHVTRCTVCVIL